MNPTWEDPIEDEEENLYDKTISYGRDAVIFLIDATQDMFSTSEEEIPFHLCLRCARTSLANKIVSNNRDLQAVVFFGTGKNNAIRDSSSFPHIYVFQDLGEPGAERILEIEDLMNKESVKFAEEYGHSKEFSLADALWTCSIIFSNCSVKLGQKRVFLFTTTDSPHENDAQLQTQAKTKAKDLFENNIEIELMHIRKPDSVFDTSRFFKNILHSLENEHCSLPDASEKFDDLLIRVRSKDHRKRALGSVKFTFGEGVQMGVQFFKLVVPTPKPTASKLCRENNAELTSSTKIFLGDTGEVLLSSDIRKYQEYSGKKIYLDEDEVRQVRRLDEPGLVLMGFKPRSLLKLNHHIRASMFMYPDEKSVAGSTCLFHALLIQLKKRDYVAICRLIMRQNDPLKFVALLPQEEVTDPKGAQSIPPGFHVVYLPFMEDIRNIKPEPKHHPSEGLVEKAKEIIKKLQFAYHPESFENPVLQKHWRNIEALALNRDAPEEITDYTLPTKDIIEKRAGKLIDEFKTLICPGAQNASSADKRQTGSSYGQPSKKIRMEDAVIPVNLLSDASSGQLGRYKVNILKEFCKRNGVRCGTKKAEIIEAIRKFYNL